MAGKISELIEILKEESRVYKDLLDLTERERDIIVSGKAAEIEAVTKDIEKLLAVSSRLEKDRLVSFETFKEKRGLSEAKTLSDLAAHIEGDAAREIRLIQDEMSKVVKRLSEASKTNAELLKKNLGYVEFLLKNLSGDQTYQLDASKRNSSGPKIFNARA
ncbi:MAG: flagellar protein FlgN [Actinomycetota bacterium]|nr:flagellar protein FlgN [Actinomycetota bacterium]